MDFIREKIRVTAKKLETVMLIEKTETDFEYTDCPEYKKTTKPPETGWKKFNKGERFCGKDTHKWIRLRTDKKDIGEGKYAFR